MMLLMYMYAIHVGNLSTTFAVNNQYHNAPICIYGRCYTLDTVVADAARLLEKGTLKMKGNLLVQVSAPTSHKLHDLGNFHIVPSLDDLLEYNHKMLHISNIPTGISEQYLKMYLENTRRSGGGKILDLTYRQDSKEAKVEFRGVQGKEISCYSVWHILVHQYQGQIDTVKNSLIHNYSEIPPVFKRSLSLGRTCISI